MVCKNNGSRIDVATRAAELKKKRVLLYTFVLPNHDVAPCLAAKPSSTATSSWSLIVVPSMLVAVDRADVLSFSNTPRFDVVSTLAATD